MTPYQSVIAFVSGKFSKMGAETEIGQVNLGYGHKILLEVSVDF